ncbi:uncharacterized protein DS421_5g139530 [Arachis hypogaea]|nr:uncharacterized protein DS421_5g139530 [Arachis hypogaea]
MNQNDQESRSEYINIYQRPHSSIHFPTSPDSEMTILGPDLTRKTMLHAEHRMLGCSKGYHQLYDLSSLY